MGADDEQPESAGGGNDPDRADLQLTRGEQLTLFGDLSFPTESEQITSIDEAESTPNVPFAFSFSQEEIDMVLIHGANAENARMNIVLDFMKQKHIEQIAETVRANYRGGSGFVIDGLDMSAWYGEDGIRLSRGLSARNSTCAHVISWTDAAVRIGELLDAGQYVTNVQLAEAGPFERTQLAQSLWYLYHDFSEDARGQYFSESMFTGGFPDSTARIADMLADEFMRDTITTELSRFADDYHENPGLLRFHYHKVDVLTEQFRELALPRREYSSELAEIPPVKQFITQDEIHDVLTSGSNVSGGKNRIYDYFIGNHSQQELQEFLKNEYGIGGRSHALSGAAHSNEWHDGRGIRLEKLNCTPVELSWTNVTKRIYEAIRDNSYFTPEEWKQRQAIEESHAETEPAVVYTAEENNLPYNIVIERLKNDDSPPPENFRITDDNLGIGGAKAKFRMNMDAIHTLKHIEAENRHAAPEEQEVLSKYVGWGGLADAFDDSKENWRNEYAELSAVLTSEEYEAARSSTLNAHYTSPTVIKAIYEAVGSMGFQTGNILEPAMGIGNFFGLLPEEMTGSKLYGVELD
ncbi:MAG: hypothetical protein IKI93_02635, partial [Clostridia bacterium]|nr:hypothetical protein [Clostridia bacterium]